MQSRPSSSNTSCSILQMMNQIFLNEEQTLNVKRFDFLFKRKMKFYFSSFVRGQQNLIAAEERYHFLCVYLLVAIKVSDLLERAMVTTSGQSRELFI